MQRRRFRFSIAARFAFLLALMAALSLATDYVAVHGMSATGTRISTVYNIAERTGQIPTQFAIDVNQTATHAVQILVENDRAAILSQEHVLRTTDIPAVNADLARWATAEAQMGPGAPQALDQIVPLWSRFVTLDDMNRFDSLSSGRAAQSASEQLSHNVVSMFARLGNIASGALHRQNALAKRAYATAESEYHGDRTVVLIAGGIVILAGILLTGWLITTTVPRIRRYSRFSRQVAAGDTRAELRVVGNDELTDLGHALNRMVRGQLGREARERSQAEFARALQDTQAETEAYDLIKRHLERSIDNSAAVLLNRNNSDDRLHAMTAAPEQLTTALLDAEPRSCLAVRSSRTHSIADGTPPLVECELCGRMDSDTTCVPLVVSGEVIGSVLVTHAEPLDDRERSSLEETVAQAAPVLGNLRTLAIAEQRAATDALTGLPNRRTVDETVKLMVAQASRSVTPVAALALDLDHFKRINDRYGHGKGDDLLAAFAATLTATVRDSDFVGRTGGEEFLVLMPDTDIAGAQVVAEKIRAAVAEISLPAVPEGVTVSVGIAVLPDHATDRERLLRHADRALYVAKNNGRDRTVIFGASEAPGIAAEATSVPSVEIAA